MLSLERSQLKQWNRDGYVLLSNALGPDQRAELACWVGELAHWPEAPGRWMKWYEQTAHGRQLCRMDDFVPYHPGMADLLQSGELAVDSYLPHRSGPNHSERPRRALYVTYNRVSAGSHRAGYLQHERAVFPPECERAPGVDYSQAAAIYDMGNPRL